MCFKHRGGTTLVLCVYVCVDSALCLLPRVGSPPFRKPLCHRGNRGSPIKVFSCRWGANLLLDPPPKTWQPDATSQTSTPLYSSLVSIGEALGIVCD